MNKLASLVFFFAGVAAVLAARAFSPAQASPAPALPVGYYDPQKVFAQSRDAKVALAAADAKANAEGTAAQRAVDAFHAAEKTPLSADALAAQRDEAVKLVNAYEDAKKEHRRAVETKFDERIAAAVGKLAVARRMTLVFPIAGKLPYAAADADLTAAVVAAIDKGDR